MGALVIAAVPIAVVNELFQLAALELCRNTAYLSRIPSEERHALALKLVRNER